MIKTFDRTTCGLVKADVMDALKAVALKHGIQFNAKAGTYNPDGTNFSFKLEAATIGDNGIAETPERTNFQRLAGMYGLQAEWLDKTFRHGDDTMTIIGLNTKKHKNPVLCKSKVNGKTYIFPANAVEAFMVAQTNSSVVA